jgi:hypothetical protein
MANCQWVPVCAEWSAFKEGDKARYNCVNNLYPSYGLNPEFVGSVDTEYSVIQKQNTEFSTELVWHKHHSACVLFLGGWLGYIDRFGYFSVQFAFITRVVLVEVSRSTLQVTFSQVWTTL